MSSNAWSTGSVVDINVSCRRALEEELDAAVKHLQAAAMSTRTRGILITRHHPGSYTAKLSEEVPFGVTLERLG